MKLLVVRKGKYLFKNTYGIFHAILWFLFTGVVFSLL